MNFPRYVLLFSLYFSLECGKADKPELDRSCWHTPSIQLQFMTTKLRILRSSVVRPRADLAQELEKKQHGWREWKKCVSFPDLMQRAMCVETDEKWLEDNKEYLSRRNLTGDERARLQLLEYLVAREEERRPIYIPE